MRVENRRPAAAGRRSTPPRASGPDTPARAAALGLDISHSLERNDAHCVFARLDALVATGPTRNKLSDHRPILVTA